MVKKVLVTGGSGFVGTNLRKYMPEWTFVNSLDYNLTNMEDCRRMLYENNPDAVIHLAGKVGGIKANLDNPASFYYDNIVMNTNVIHACYLHRVKRLMASLSTCAFPDKLPSYPFSEDNIFDGPPSKSNLSYGYSKRAMLVQLNAYRCQYGVNYTAFSPSNIYGPHDTFCSDNSHFVPAMIRKLLQAKEGSEVVFWGTGAPLRQQLYVDDLVKIIPELLDKHNDDKPIIVSPDENLSIKEMVSICLDILNKNVRVVFNQDNDGQFRKDGANNKLKGLIKDLHFTNFKDGLEKTINWYKNSLQFQTL